MYAPVRHQSAGIIPEKAEVIVKAIRIKRSFGCRTKPHVVIYAGRRRAIWFDRQGRFPVLIRPYFHCPDASDATLFHKVGCFVPMRIAALPLANLYDAVVFAGSLDHQITFLDGIGKRFLNVDIFSCLAGFNGRQAVPVVGSPDDYKIYILIVNYFSPVFIKIGNFLSCFLLNVGGSFLQPLVIYVTEGNTFHFRILKKST